MRILYKNAVFFICLFSLVCFPGYSGTGKDSVISIYNVVRNKNSTDTDISKSDSVLLLDAITISKRINYIKGEAQCYDILGVHERNRSNYSMAIEYHQKAYQLIENSPLLKEKAVILNNIGVVYRRLDDLKRATEYHLLALEIAEGINDRATICVSLNSLGNIYLIERKYQSALENFTAALEKEKADKNLLGVAINYNNIGSTYEAQGKYEKAIEFYLKSLSVNINLGSKKGIGICYLSLGEIYTNLNKLGIAREYLSKAIEIHKYQGDKIYAASALIKIGKLYNKEKNFDSAIHQFNEGLVIAKSIHSKNNIYEAYLGLSNTYELIGRVDSALSLYKLSILFKDSILNEANARDLNLKQVLYETGKKDKEIELLKYKQSVKDKKQKLIIGALILGCIVLLVWVILIYINYRLKRKAHAALLEYNKNMEEKNRILTMQKEEILTQRDEIESKNYQLQEAIEIIKVKNNNITDNIRYAVQIQNALLPDNELVKNLLPQSFIYYKPKDLVSGDFYWITKNNNKIVLAVADCTGHGVTGAFMSILGITALNEVVEEQGITSANLILNTLRSKLISILQQGDTYNESREGIHMVVCTLDIQNKQLQFAGAINTIFLIRENQIHQYKGDKMPVSISPEILPYTAIDIPLQDNDMIYLFSDGYYGQFGGNDDKKFSIVRFRTLLQKISHQPLEEQQSIIERTFLAWKGRAEQVDDVLIMGVRI